MLPLIIMFFCTVALGIYFILADILKMPRLKTSRAVYNTIQHDKKKTRNFETFTLEIAIKVSKFIKLDEYRKQRMQYTLKSVGVPVSPEVFIARAWVKSGLVSLTIIPALFVLPLISPVIIFLSVAIYFKEIKSADEKQKIKREAVESELPRFVSTIEQELRATRDVLSILENYKKHSGEIFGRELEITCADMRSGSYESALTRFETRMNSSQVSDVVRGLISVIRGDNGIQYFQMLARDFKMLELQKLKMIAIKRPSKIRKYSFLMVVCFILTYLVVMGLQIMKSMNGLF